MFPCRASPLSRKISKLLTLAPPDCQVFISTIENICIIASLAISVGHSRDVKRGIQSFIALPDLHISQGRKDRIINFAQMQKSQSALHFQ